MQYICKNNNGGIQINKKKPSMIVKMLNEKFHTNLKASMFLHPQFLSYKVKTDLGEKWILCCGHRYQDNKNLQNNKAAGEYVFNYKQKLK